MRDDFACDNNNWQRKERPNDIPNELGTKKNWNKKHDCKKIETNHSNKLVEASTKQHSTQCILRTRKKRAAQHRQQLTLTPVLISRWNFCYWRIKNYREWDAIFVCACMYSYTVALTVLPVFYCQLARSFAWASFAFYHYIRSATRICDSNLCTCILFNKNHHIISYSEKQANEQTHENQCQRKKIIFVIFFAAVVAAAAASVQLKFDEFLFCVCCFLSILVLIVQCTMYNCITCHIFLLSFWSFVFSFFLFFLPW